ncbi:MAG: hypothetical protein HRT66_06490 [Flavobacteriaceae bacterium]|nr:hypothetical protein [Flavobacteriaceae bacterium]
MKKRILTFLVLLIVQIGYSQFNPYPEADTDYGNSRRTEQGTKVRLVNSEWEIDENGTHYGLWFVEDLQAMDKGATPYVYSGLNKFVLMNNLDFNKDDSYRSVSKKPEFTTGKGFTPIDLKYIENFYFEGNNKSINNLYMNNSFVVKVKKDSWGHSYNFGTSSLFVSVVSGSIYSLRITAKINININKSVNGLPIKELCVSALIGESSKSTALNIMYCNVSLSPTINSNVQTYVGGFVGSWEAKSSGSLLQFAGCYSSSAVTTNGSVSITAGGLLGDGGWGVFISYCNTWFYVNGNIVSSGGLVGSGDWVRIDKSYTEVQFSDKDKAYNMGGLIGFAEYAYIFDSYSKGHIFNESNNGTYLGMSANAGGLVGSANHTLRVYRAYSDVEINVQDPYTVGGIVGDGGKELVLDECYTLGTIVTSTFISKGVGGIVGYASRTGTRPRITKCVAFQKSIYIGQSWSSWDSTSLGRIYPYLTKYNKRGGVWGYQKVVKWNGTDNYGYKFMILNNVYFYNWAYDYKFNGGNILVLSPTNMPLKKWQTQAQWNSRNHDWKMKYDSEVPGSFRPVLIGVGEGR